ncbi:MAG: type II toxin-antitoxin system RelE/ParE family toxin [Bacteroidales bacterium]
MRKIILSKRAATKLENLLEYLETEWSIKVKKDFIKKLDRSFDLIKEFPESTEESNLKKGLRKCVISKQTTAYFQFDSETIKIVTIFDNRMNPKYLKKEI